MTCRCLNYLLNSTGLSFGNWTVTLPDSVAITIPFRPLTSVDDRFLLKMTGHPIFTCNSYI